MNTSAVAQLVDHMKAGTFMETHQGIARDRSGYLMDGQHRLSAVVQSGISQNMFEATYAIDLIQENGLLHPVMKVFDKGRMRTIGQNLKLNGMQNANLIAAICNAIRGQLLGQWQNKATEQAIEAIYSVYQLSIDAILSVGWGGERRAPLLAALVMFHAAMPEEAIRLSTAISTMEGLNAKSPELALSKFLREQMGQMTGHTQRIEAMNRVINGCMKFADGEQVSSLCSNESALERFLAMHKRQKELLTSRFNTTV